MGGPERQAVGGVKHLDFVAFVERLVHRKRVDLTLQKDFWRRHQPHRGLAPRKKQGCQQKGPERFHAGMITKPHYKPKLLASRCGMLGGGAIRHNANAGSLN